MNEFLQNNIVLTYCIHNGDSLVFTQTEHDPSKHIFFLFSILKANHTLTNTSLATALEEEERNEKCVKIVCNIF